MGTENSFPGSSIGRSLAFISVIVLLGTSLYNGVLQYSSPVESNAARLIVSISAILGAALALVSISTSIMAQFMIPKLPPSEQPGESAKVFICRQYLLMATCCFYFLLSFSILYLGGILNSPYTSLLTISSLYLLFSTFGEDDRASYQKYFEANNLSYNEEEYERTFKINSYLRKFPVIIIIFTITVGELIIAGYDQDFFIRLLGQHSLSMNGGWWKVVSYSTFYISYGFVIYYIFTDFFNRSIYNIFNSIFSCLVSFRCGLLGAISAILLYIFWTYI